MKTPFLPTGLAPAVFTAFALILNGCGSKKPRDLKGDCHARFDKIHWKFEKKKYSYAKEGYSDFIVSCTGTENSEQAHYELATSQFLLKDWMEAEQEFGSFLKEFPSSKRYAEIARYRLALSMSRQTEIPQRDQSKTVLAIKEFETFAVDYPDSPRADSAQKELEVLRNLLAERDMLVARLYRRMDEPLAAAIYYKRVLKEYGDRVPRREIALRLTECYIDLNQFTEAEAQLSPFDGIAKDDPFREQVKATHRKLEAAQARYARQKKLEKEEAQKPRPL